MGLNQIKGNNKSFGDLICSKCNSHLLLELFQSKERIMLRRYCFCGSLTTYINEDIKFLLIRHNFDKVIVAFKCLIMMIY